MQVSLDSPAVIHGIGLFETMLVKRGAIGFLEEHLARMTSSAMTLGFPLPDAPLFRREAERAAAVATNGEAALRCVYVAGGSSIADPWTLAARCGEIPPLTISRRAHGRVATLHSSLARSLPQHKLTSYAACVVGLRRAVAAGADEGLFVTRGGEILEGTATNVFAVAGDRLITAPVAAGVLPGIVRAWALAEAGRLGIPTEERPPSVAELLGGSFLTGSLTGLAAVSVVDGQDCHPPGQVFKALMDGWTTGISLP